MKISYNWLKEYIETDLSPEEVADILTNTGLEVETMEEFESVKGGLRGLVVGKVKTCEPHPDADRLSVCTVDIGGDSLLPVVCGAPNVRAGQKVVFAGTGTTLYRGDETFSLKKVKIRGQVSEGMICSEDEVGLGEDHEGIIVLGKDARPGTPVSDYYKVETDTVFELGLTPNRIDGASHIGAARDLAAHLSLERETGITLPPTGGFRADNHDLEIPVIIENPDACRRYAGVTISGVRIGESPGWLKTRLRSIGQNPINNVVDITNFVLHELGQPLHAFDADRIEGGEIHVRTLDPGSKFTTLDEVERTLEADDLMICDTGKGMCIGGVFGGLHSGVGNKTRNVFLESAYFDPGYIRRTARRHGLNTDASYRFERGVDPEMVLPALKRAAILICEIAGGRISSGIVDEYPRPLDPHEIMVEYNHIDRLVGKGIERPEIRRILASLDFEIISSDENSMKLRAPAYRVDVTREADVIEEILRIYGYNNVDFRERILSVISHTSAPDKEKLQQAISDYLSGNGFNEIWCNSLSREAYYRDDPDAVILSNPLSSDLSRMRTTLLYGGLETIAYNVNRKKSNLRLYEFGNIYQYKAGTGGEELLAPYREVEHLALFITGKKHTGNWLEKEVPSSFYDLKAFVENILIKLDINPARIEIHDPLDGIFSEAIAYRLNGERLIDFGIISDDLASKFDLNGKVYYADMNWALLVKHAGGQLIEAGTIPRYPAVRRDLSMIIDHRVNFSEIRDIAFRAERKLLKDVSLFDVYESGKMEKGKKSYAVSFTLQDLTKTLTDDEIERIMEKIQRGLENGINAAIRQAQN